MTPGFKPFTVSYYLPTSSVLFISKTSVIGYVSSYMNIYSVAFNITLTVVFKFNLCVKQHPTTM